MKRKGTAMQKSAQITGKSAISALLAFGVLGAPAQLLANPWNPFPAPQANAAQVERAPVMQPQVPAGTRSRFAPAGLEQQLTAAPRTRLVPNAYAPQGYGYAQQGYGFTPNAPAYSQAYPPAYPPAYSRGTGYGGYPQAYGGYPGGYPGGFSNYSNQGNGTNGPFSPFGFPGGAGGFNPFPGNLTNGGIPGFNVSPFGFF